MAENYVTKDMDLSGRLQEEGCSVIGITTDPVDKLPIHTFEEDVSEINKIIGTNINVKTASVPETKEEAPNEPQAPKKRGPKPKRR